MRLVVLLLTLVPLTSSLDEAELLAFGEAWAAALVAGDGFRAVEPERRAAASGVLEEFRVQGDAAQPVVPTGFGAAFSGGTRKVKLLDFGPNEARFRLGFVDADHHESALVELVAERGETWRARSYVLRWTRPLAGRFVDVTRDLLAHDAASAEVLALGVDALRERLDPRLGLPLVGHVAGLAAGDVDGDGRTDLVLAQPGGVANRVL
ncbi:MAG: FG-GAP repeat protein, partial [Planctomycetota bacterium]